MISDCFTEKNDNYRRIVSIPKDQRGSGGPRINFLKSWRKKELDISIKNISDIIYSKFITIHNCKDLAFGPINLLTEKILVER